MDYVLALNRTMYWFQPKQRAGYANAIKCQRAGDNRRNMDNKDDRDNRDNRGSRDNRDRNANSDTIIETMVISVIIGTIRIIWVVLIGIMGSAG